MSGPRRDRILAGTALALILAAPFAALAQEGTNAGAKSAAVATGASSAGSGKTQDPAAYPGDEPTGTLNAAPAAPASPAAAIEQSAAPDPLASLDPADRVVAEKIRDLLARKRKRFSSARRSVLRSRASIRAAASLRYGSTRAWRTRAPSPSSRGSRRRCRRPRGKRLSHPEVCRACLRTHSRRPISS